MNNSLKKFVIILKFDQQKTKKQEIAMPKKAE